MIRRRIAIFGIAGLLVLGGCANFSTPLSIEQKPDPASGYLFGRFKMATRGFLNTTRMGIYLQSDNSDHFLLEFVETGDGINAVAVPPGNYRIIDMVAAYGDGELAGHWQIGDANVTAPFEVNAGSAYYIGDYSGTSTKGFKAAGVGINWHLNTIGCSPQTILDFQAKYVALGQTTIVSPLKLPPKDPREPCH